MSLARYLLELEQVFNFYPIKQKHICFELIDAVNVSQDITHLIQVNASPNKHVFILLEQKLNEMYKKNLHMKVLILTNVCYLVIKNVLY